MFTIVPLDVEGEEVMSLAKRFYLVTLVGVFLGLLSGILMYVLTEVYGPLISAVIVIFVIMGLNRFLHLDGLSDMGDGLMVLGDKERKLSVMKDSHVGAGGLAYAMLFVLLSISALANVDRGFYFLAPFAAEVLIKVSMVTCAALGEAREGLGGIFVKNTSSGTVAVALAIGLVATVPAYILLAPARVDLAELTSVLLMMIIASLVTGAVVARTAMKHFGVVNGDILGATNEIARPMVLLALSGALWLAEKLL
ncbi:MAG: adenosylcobinamide-GDP ribazoletransferase [Methanomassiliicoccales archaeon]|nr:MAG: adenosylcobinamide-GDP ribazoletransferase [Methanomassiliicoccales archaeon]